VCNEWILVAVRTKIIGLLYLSPYSCNILHLQRQQASLFTQNWVSAQFLQQLGGAPAPKALRSRLREGCIFPNPTPWPPPRITEPGSAIGDCGHTFQIKSSKKIYWWYFTHFHSRFQRQYIDFECKNFVSGFGPREIMVSQLVLTAIMTTDHDASGTFSVGTLECRLTCSLQPATQCTCLYSYYYWSSYIDQ